MTANERRHKIADVDELQENGSRVIAEVEASEIAVFRLDDDYYAMANFCVHQSGPLCEGPVSGRMKAGDDGWEWEYDEEDLSVVCPWHGWMFDVKTGDCVVDKNYSAPTYDVEVDGDEVFVVR